ncbi:hypothetical protein CEP54_016081 [Fusarium duplospermum]|uniref:Uncharacterized protein n=1 Tax=Fusarium duplospermum TaxID=1325734 RepID=A0A428NIH9_9HYPO|nr:hypothetical protein CEP54_016081 [Fusarium duplospermum]
MNAQDQADNLHASSIGPIPSLNDFDPTNHTVRERPEDLNQHDLDLRENQEELSPSKSGRNCLRPAYARKSGSRRSRLRLAYALKSKLTPKSGHTLKNRTHKLGRMCGVPSLVFYYNPSTRCWTGQAYVPSNQPTPDWNCVLDTI